MACGPDRDGSGASLMASLMRDPLNPTRPTPAITVMRETHLCNKVSRLTINDKLCCY